MAMVSDPELLQDLESIALAAGQLILKIRAADFTIEHKSDASPVTEADRAAETIILGELRSRYPQWPCVAEEEVSAGYIPKRLNSSFFLIDALDGTKEFVRGSGDFTVNIALIRDNKPVVGVVYAPAHQVMFAGLPGRAEVIELDEAHTTTSRRQISVRDAPGRPVVLASRSHRSPATDAFIARIVNADVVAIGSSLKFCRIAAGEADVYPRFGRTMEWDTAAGDAVLRAAGGCTVSMDGKPLAYGTRTQPGNVDFANPEFVAAGNPGFLPGLG
jgi:3'(2'), 5'-bisphosphate nucleotidase